MKSLFVVAVALAATAANAQSPRSSYASCNIATQHALRGEIGGSIKDPGQAHISLRANILQADISSARTARHLAQAQADTLFKKVQAIRTEYDHFVKKQGFLSAAERASYDRQLDTIALRICRA